MITNVFSIIRRVAVMAAILLTVGFTSSAQKMTKLTVPVDTLKARAAADGERYNALLTRFIAADTTLTVEDAAFVYYGYYSAPIERKTPSFTDRINALDSVKAGNYEAGYALFCKLIEDNPVGAQNIYKAYLCAKRTGRAEEAKSLLFKSQMLARVIIASGDGKTAETALHVNEISDEYFFLYDIVKVPPIKGQRLVVRDDHKYDVLTIEERGKTVDIYFQLLISAAELFN